MWIGIMPVVILILSISNKRRRVGYLGVVWADAFHMYTMNTSGSCTAESSGCPSLPVGGELVDVVIDFF